MPQCRLCHQEHELRNSHIVPEFLYGGLYNQKNHLMAINGRGRQGWKPLQQGIREKLFCEACEQHFNEYCEKPFRRQWCGISPLPNPWTEPEIIWLTVDYSSFKLFHLSILFRASVSSLPTYSEVALGPHEDRMRNMLINRDPGHFWQYPVMGRAVIHHKTHAIIDMVSKAERLNHNGQRCYGIMFGGVQWFTLVSSQRNQEFESASLQADGRIPFHAVPWNEVPIMQEASRALKRARP